MILFAVGSWDARNTRSMTLGNQRGQKPFFYHNLWLHNLHHYPLEGLKGRGERDFHVIDLLPEYHLQSNISLQKNTP